MQGSALPERAPSKADAGVPGEIAEAPSSDLDGRLDAAIEDARGALHARQAEDGHWIYELEADVTIPAEYILLGHFLDDVDREAEEKLARYLRRTQGEDGGWPLFYAGEANLSATVKAYYALKLAGDAPEEPHMKRARDSILERGGAARANVFTRITLALFGQAPWRAVPVMPIEIMLLPRWFPFHLSKISYWSRTVLTPLLVLMHQKPQARNPRGVDIAELFVAPPFEEGRYLVNPTGAALGNVFLALDRVLRVVTPLFPEYWKRKSQDRAVAFFTERLNGVEGLGGIFPAMANAVMVFHTLGYADDDPTYVQAKEAVRRLLVFAGDSGYCQPCLSPVWDTALAALALMEADEPEDGPALRKAAEWLAEHQVLDVDGDWRDNRPNTRPGGWAFQYSNAYYPDTDDTSAVAMAIDRLDDGDMEETMARAEEWILGMQNDKGGWASFDTDNTYYYLNHIPFADHGALLDPPTSDVTGRCIGLLAQRGHGADHPAIARGIDFLLREQEEDGSWYGRWGTNYIYGTWSVLCALNAVGHDPEEPHVQKAVEWLKSRQRQDGGWGEDCATYWPDRRDVVKESTASQTAWALLALMAAGEVHSAEVVRGVRYLLDAPRQNGEWRENLYNAVGFPRVFFLKYHGYSAYFPLWALARYRHLKIGNGSGITTPHGM